MTPTCAPSPAQPARPPRSRLGALALLVVCVVCAASAACVAPSSPSPTAAAPALAAPVAAAPAVPIVPAAPVAAPVPDRAPPALPDPSLEVPPDLPPAPPLWRLPATPPPAEGWPVVMLLHGWRSNEQDFAQVASWFAAQGVVAVAVPAIHTEDHPTSRRLAWPQDDSARVHRYLQRLLETSPHRAHLGGPVWLGGFSQGARYALTLTAEHPDRYAGALAISPAGWSAHPTALRAPRPLYLIGGAAEIPRYRQGFLDAKALWERHPDAPLRVVEHSGGHHFPPDTERALTDALRWLRAAQSAP